jgi:hypothetical protein
MVTLIGSIHLLDLRVWFERLQANDILVTFL